MELRQYIKKKWIKAAFAAACLLLLGTAEIILVPYSMEQWSHDRKIGMLHVLLGIGLGLAGAGGLLLFYRKEYILHGRKWKEELVRITAGYALVQCIAGCITGTAGILLYQACRVSYEHTKTALYLLNALWQNLFRVWLVFYMAGRLYGRKWPEGFPGNRQERRRVIREWGAVCLAAVVLAGLQEMPGGFIRRPVMLFMEVGYLSVLAVYSTYRLSRELH